MLLVPSAVCSQPPNIGETSCLFLPVGEEGLFRVRISGESLRDGLAQLLPDGPRAEVKLWSLPKRIGPEQR